MKENDITTMQEASKRKLLRSFGQDIAELSSKIVMRYVNDGLSSPGIDIELEFDRLSNEINEQLARNHSDYSFKTRMKLKRAFRVYRSYLEQFGGFK
jgi:nucleoid-associated protein YejK